MTTRRLVVWITFLAVFAMSARVSVDTDTWWHLRAGQWMVENRAVLRVDTFSYTRYGEPWQYPGWLVEAPMYLIYQVSGPGGLNLWTAAIVTLAFTFVWRTLTGGPFLRAFVIVLAAAASGIYWAARPYMVTFVLAAVFLWILEDFRWNRSPAAARRLWWLPLLMILWANSHGGFAVGFLLWGVYWFADGFSWIWQRAFVLKLKHAIRNLKGSLRDPEYILWWVGLLMILAVCLNPHGPKMLAYPFKTVSIGALQQYIQEWQPPDFHSISVQPFLWLLLLTFGAVGASRRRLALTDFLLVAGFTYMSLMAGRNVALFALAAPPVLTRYAAPLLQRVGRMLGIQTRPPRRKVGRVQSLVNGLLLGLLILVVLIRVSLFLPVSANEEEFRGTLPLDAVTFIQDEMPPGRLFNSYNWGGYLLWELPEYPVFVDGRTDLYDDDLINQWLQVVRAEDGWQQVLDAWDVNLIILEPVVPAVDALGNEGWRLLYQDDMAVVYAR